MARRGVRAQRDARWSSGWAPARPGIRTAKGSPLTASAPAPAASGKPQAVTGMPLAARETPRAPAAPLPAAKATKPRAGLAPAPGAHVPKSNVRGLTAQELPARALPAQESNGPARTAPAPPAPAWVDRPTPGRRGVAGRHPDATPVPAPRSARAHPRPAAIAAPRAESRGQDYGPPYGGWGSRSAPGKAMARSVSARHPPG